MSSSSEPPSPTLGRTFLDRLTSVFHEEELNDRADVLEVLGEARRRNVIDDEVFSMMEGAMAVSEIRAGDLMVPRSQVQAVDFSEPREVWLPALIASGHSRLPALAGVWTLAEWLRGDVLANFGWLMPGYAVIDTPLAGWAPLGGIYAVTLAQLLFAALVAVALSCRLAWLAVPVIGAALIADTGQVSRQHAWSEPSSTVDVRIIQPALPVVDAYTRANPAQRIEALFPAAFKPWPASDRPRLLLTPEGIVNVPVSRLGREAAGRLVLLQEKTEARVLFNGFRKDGPRFFNTSFVLDEGQIAYRLDKRELVPFGEYVPAGSPAALRFLSRACGSS